jgi:hypothetical protein
MSELDLKPTPDRPPLPTRVPKPVDTEPVPPAAPATPVSVPSPAPASSQIQIEMQHNWFSEEDEPADTHGMPTAGYAPPPSPVTVAAQPAPTVPKPRPSGDDRWRSAADEGWQRAMAASDPKDAGTTRSGLPKRIPQAQLVPGGVETTPRQQHRRNADEVRGLLSAYHRGVQRGRTDGVAETAAAATQAPKEKEQ